MKIKLDPWQKEIEKAKGDICLCTGRRVGKTYIMAKKASDRMVKEPNLPVVIVSLTEDQAMIIHFMALHYIEENYPKTLDKRHTTLKRLTLKNGSVMITRPVGDTGDAARGYEGGILIVDEASRMPPKFWMAAKPILLTTDGEIWMCSTPHGKQGYFWEKFNESYNLKRPDARFKTFYISSEEVMKNRPISESWTQKQRDGALRILEEEKRDMTELEYGQEYLGLFLEDLRQFFPDDLIEKCCTIKDTSTMLVQGDKFMGVDVGRVNETVLVSVYRVGRKKDRIIMFDLDVKENQTITDTARLIIHKDKQINHRKIYIDATGMGWGVFDITKEDPQTKRKVVAIENVKKSLDIPRLKTDEQKKTTVKEDLYNNLKNLMEMDKAELIDSPELKQSLRSIQSDNSQSKLKIFGNYSHITEALIRAAWCTKEKGLNIFARTF